MTEAAPFRPTEILAVLARHEVTYILIGGLAATLHGAAYVTVDLDITPSPDAANLERLSAALAELEARVRVGASSEHEHLSTNAGDLDICLTPAGTAGYDDLRRDAVRIMLAGNEVAVASLADVVRSKEAAGRDKDRLALPMLRRLLEEQRRT
jgi:hypothetical protein